MGIASRGGKGSEARRTRSDNVAIHNSFYKLPSEATAMPTKKKTNHERSRRGSTTTAARATAGRRTRAAASSGLATAPVAATLPYRGLRTAQEFYSRKLGLERVSGSVDDGYLEYRAGQGTVLQLFESSSSKKSDNTAATFEVADLDREMAHLRTKGVVFEEYDLPGIKTVNGVASLDEMGRGAWFKDPDGNVIALHEGGNGSRRSVTRSSRR
jgi:catechol 2,3-dioxygenase-like lactoylglutathione lyase family enzyme